MSVFLVTFNISKAADGRYCASCSELAAFAEAPTLSELEAALRVLAMALLAEATEGRAHETNVIITRTFPSLKSAAKVS